MENIKTENLNENNELKKEKKKTNPIVIIEILLVVLLIGIFGGSHFSDYKEKQIKELKSSTITYLGQDHAKEEIETTLKTNFEKLSKEDCTEIIDLYIHAAYAVSSQAMIDDEMTNDIYATMNENKEFDFDKIKNEETKKMCETLYNQNIVLRFVNGNLFFDVDYGYFADTYGKYVQDDFREMLLLFDEEKKNDYYDAETDTMNASVVEERLLKVYEILEKYPNSGIKGSAEDYYNFYKKIYLGAYAQDYIYETGARIKNEVVSRYPYFAEKVKDEEFKNFLVELSESYAEADNSRTVEIYAMIKEHCGVEE